VLDDPTWMSKAKVARQMALRRYSTSRMADELMSLYATVLNN
jgi:hypothetical protein